MFERIGKVQDGDIDMLNRLRNLHTVLETLKIEDAKIPSKIHDIKIELARWRIKL